MICYMQMSVVVLERHTLAEGVCKLNSVRSTEVPY